VKALDRKLLRDLRRMWSQALTIALVVASGIGGFLTSLSAVDSLAMARDRFYADGRFADVFASAKRVPDALIARLRELPGVADAQPTLEQIVRVERAGLSDPIIGQLIGVDRQVPARMNLLTLASGRPLPGTGQARTDGSIDALVSVGFAKAHGLQPGSRLSAIINGKRRDLVVAGTAMTPEFIFAGLWGMPDTRGFGVFWVDRDALEAAFGMQGAFNRVALKLAPGASERAVIDQLTRVLARYGSYEAYGRDEQVSHAMLDNEIKEQRILGTVLPVIFLGVAAFLLNVVVARLVSTQREQIAALKALGYDNTSIGVHYLKFVLLIVAFGLVLGVVVGGWLGAMLTGLYAEFFQFPSFEHSIAPALMLTGTAIAVATACAGTLNAIIATVRLPPAEAMRPPAPASYRRTLMERLGVERMGAALRMIVRNMERRPLRTALSVGGIAAAVAIVVMGNFFRDAIDNIVDTQFNLGLRGDLSVWTTEPVDNRTALELRRLPGVLQVESTRFVPVTLVHGHRRERGMIRGYAPRPELYRVIDVEQRETLLEGRGLVLTDRLAAKLGLRVGDPVQVQVMTGKRRTLTMPVGAIVREMMGLNVYLERPALNRLLGDGDIADGFVLSVERGAESAVLRAIRKLPRAAGAWSKATMLRNMEEISARNIRIMSTILTVFASVIAVGVVYNSARIALSERRRELASLRVLGFTRAEVSTLLLGELAIAVLLALPLGMLLGWGLTTLITELLKSDQFLFPAVIRARTYALAALCVLAAAVVSALVVRRNIDRLDMVEALKTRE
jgi:putative ABC transport system permease protein